MVKRFVSRILWTRWSARGKLIRRWDSEDSLKSPMFVTEGGISAGGIFAAIGIFLNHVLGSCIQKGVRGM